MQARSHGFGNLTLVILPWAVLGIAFCYLVIRIMYLPIEADELEFHRATLWVAQGKLPYRDFWEHHLPLQWYLIAPFAEHFSAPTAWSVLALRWIQLFFLFGTVALIWSLACRRGVRLRVMVLLTAAPIGSLMYGNAFAQYRIDTPMVFFYMLGLWLLDRQALGRGGGAYLFMSGVALGLACLCSQRIIPLVFMTPLFYLVGRSERKWGIRRPVLWCILGGLSMVPVVIFFFWGQGGLAAFIEQNIRDNVLYQGSSPGSTDSSLWYQAFVQPLAIVMKDYSAPVAQACGILGLAWIIFRVKSAGSMIRISLLVLFETLVLTIVKTPVVYQQETWIWLLVLNAGLATTLLAERWRAMQREAFLAATLIVLLAVLLTNTRRPWGLGAMNIAHQDHVIRTVHSVVGQEETVLDGSGWAFKCQPAYRFWFMAPISECLVNKGRYPRLDENLMIQSKPAALVMDSRLKNFLETMGPGVVEFVARNYLPLETSIWIPAPNVLLSEERNECSWIVLKSGLYRVALAAPGAMKGWFANPLAFSQLEDLDRRYNIHNPTRFQLAADSLPFPQLGGDVTVMVDGRPSSLSPGGWIELEKGHKLIVRYTGRERRAILFVPKYCPLLFQVPFPGVPLELAREKL